MVLNSLLLKKIENFTSNVVFGGCRVERGLNSAYTVDFAVSLVGNIFFKFFVNIIATIIIQQTSAHNDLVV